MLDCVQTFGGKSSNFTSSGDKITIYAVYLGNEGLPTVEYTIVINEELKSEELLLILTKQNTTQSS